MSNNEENVVRPGDTVLIRATVRRLPRTEVNLDVPLAHPGDYGLVVRSGSGEYSISVDPGLIAEVVPALPDEPPEYALVLVVPVSGASDLAVLERVDGDAGRGQWRDLTDPGRRPMTWAEVCETWAPDRHVRLYREDDHRIAVLDDGDDPPLTVSGTRVEPHPDGVLLNGIPVSAGDADLLGLALVRQARWILGGQP